MFPRASRNVGGVADARAVSRHSFELTCCTTFSLATTEDAGLIEAVEGEGSAENGDDEIDIEFAVADPNPEP